MTAIRSERLTSDDNTVAAAESGVRDFARRDISFVQRLRSEPAPDASVSSVNSLIQRVSGASLDEIERVMAQLESVRETLRSEGDRVQRELSGYAHLSQATMMSMKMINDSLMKLRPAPTSTQVRPITDHTDD